MTEELSERQQAILGILVREYIATAQPVGSKTMVEKYGLSVSSATIRSEMAALEEMDYLTHPHTSAGRVPTEHGYRYFVERLMEQSDLPEAEQRLIRHQFHQARMDLEQWMKLAAAVLAHTTHTASLVTVPRAQLSRLKHLELIDISEALVLVIVVLSEGLVRQQMVRQSQPPLSSEQLTVVSNKLNAQLAGLNRIEIGNRSIELTLFEARVRETLVEVLERVDTRSVTELYRDGLIHILRQPEFAAADSVRQILEIIEERSLLENIAAEVMRGGGLQVIIGGEGRWREISEVSMVMAPYGVEGRTAGMMGVVGPMRMPYGRAISTVRFVASLMSRLLAGVYGEEDETFGGFER
ncbi:MAG: heat-inducible transcriptional repressor HrcA [Ardenticatenaceae bacterium]|nr:heat-inducible transcriptional repressor HrcA [Ardenticatenaceae bacterium]